MADDEGQVSSDDYYDQYEYSGDNIGDNEYGEYNYNYYYGYHSTMFQSGNSTNATSSTTDSVQTQTTTSKSFTAAVTTSTPDDDKFMYMVMSIVVGAVALIMVTVFVVFAIRARRRRRLNIQIYEERQQRPATDSLEDVDRDDDVTETINGVHHALYEQDNRLPITTFDNQVFEDGPGPTSLLQTQHGSSRVTEAASLKEDDKANSNISNASKLQDQKTNDSYSVSEYENTKFTKSSKRVNVKKHSNTDIVKDNKQEDVASVKDSLTEANHDYETAFPVASDSSLEPYENIDASSKKREVLKPKTTHSQPKENENKEIKTNTSKTAGEQHTKIAKNTKTEINDNGSVEKSTSDAKSKDEKSKPKVKPKPISKPKPLTNKPHNDQKAQTNISGISSAQVKREKFQQGHLLKAVPPACNLNRYVNVPNEDELMEIVPDSAIPRQSSEYEDSEGVLKVLKKDKVNKKLETDQVNPIIVISSLEESQADSTNKINSGQAGNTAPYANIGVDKPCNNSLDLEYENEGTVNELKCTLKKMGKRGFSTSALESRKLNYIGTASGTKSENSSIDNENTYLEMDATGDDLYLEITDDSDEVYMPMKSPEGDVYMHMEHHRLSKPITRKKTQPARSNAPNACLTAPAPCGGAEYVNFSDQPHGYVNYFRSRSSDNIYHQSQGKQKPFKY